MDEQQLQQQIVQLVQAAMQGDQQATQQILQIMQAAQQGDLQAAQLAQMIQQVAQLMQQQQVQAAKFGAKLNYIKQLRGQCPEGYEMQYFKQGGPMGTKLCKQCVKKKMEEGGKTPSNPVDAFKCGRKMKKKACGGNIDFSKCGSKMKKKACGGSVEKDKCGTKMKAACGSKLPMDKCGGKTKKKSKKISKDLQGGNVYRNATYIPNVYGPNSLGEAILGINNKRIGDGIVAKDGSLFRYPSTIVRSITPQNDTIIVEMPSRNRFDIFNDSRTKATSRDKDRSAFEFLNSKIENVKTPKLKLK